MRKRLVVCTSLDGVDDIILPMFQRVFEVVYTRDSCTGDIIFSPEFKRANILFLNPNNQKFFLGAEILEALVDLECVCTASTGFVHFDFEACQSRGIKVVSLRQQPMVLEQIPSTAELALILSTMAVRRLPEAMLSVEQSNWSWEGFVGNHFNSLTVGVIGYGRLGRIYADLMDALGFDVIVFETEPTKRFSKNPLIRFCNNLDELLNLSDIVALHIHADKINVDFVDKEFLKKCKSNVSIVNTSRGELVHEASLIEFLEQNSSARYFADVISSEYDGLKNSVLFNSDIFMKQIFLTPHIGGMSRQAREIAYLASAEALIREYQSES